MARAKLNTMFKTYNIYIYLRITSFSEAAAAAAAAACLQSAAPLTTSSARGGGVAAKMESKTIDWQPAINQ